MGWEPALRTSRAKEAVAQALALDDGLGEAHGIAGLLRFVVRLRLDRRGTRSSASRWRSVPAVPTSTITSAGSARRRPLRRVARGGTPRARARTRSPIAGTSRQRAHARAGRVRGGARGGHAPLAVDPGYPGLHTVLGWAHLSWADRRGARPRWSAPSSFRRTLTLFRAQLGQALRDDGTGGEGARDAGRSSGWPPTQYVPPYHFAYVHTGLGEHDAAIDWLEHALRAAGRRHLRRQGLVSLRRACAGTLASQALLRRMNL